MYSFSVYSQCTDSIDKLQNINFLSQLNDISVKSTCDSVSVTECIFCVYNMLYPLHLFYFVINN